MLDPTLLLTIINFLRVCLQYIQLQRARRPAGRSTEWLLPIFWQMLNFMGLILQYMSLVQQVQQLQHTQNIDNLAPHELLKYFNPNPRPRVRRDVFADIQDDYLSFWWLTGELPFTFTRLHDRLLVQLSRPVNGRFIHRTINTLNRLLLTMIWMRCYPKLALLAFLFGISITLACQIIQFTVPILHAHLVPRFIRWPTAREWIQQMGTFPHFPSVVGMLDGSVFRISRPTGRMQRLFYRRDKHFHFLNWILVISAADGMITFSRCGFPGHIHDAVCYR